MSARLSLSDQARHELTADAIRRLREAHDHQRDGIVEELITLHVDVAKRVAHRYAERGVDIDDLEQVACYGLTLAAQRFDPDRGDFLSYAIPTIRGELRKHFRDRGWRIRPPRRLQELQARCWEAEVELTHLLHRSPTPRDIAAHLGVEIEEVGEAISLDGYFTVRSLDAPLGESQRTLAESWSSSLSGGAEDGDDYSACEARMMLAAAAQVLSERDKRILELRYFHDLTQQEIGEELGVTQMQVSRLLTRIHRDLRAVILGRAA